MPKIVGFMALHYGIPYIGWAIRSVIHSVDEFHIVYSDVGSHGFQTQIPCPDKRDDLYYIASQVAGDKLRWFDGHFAHEGLQRGKILDLAPDADVIVVVDSDEIYPEFAVTGIITQTIGLNVRSVRVPFAHFWRSFYRAVLHDPAYPVRVIFPKATGGEMTAQSKPVAHMGYAIPPYLCQYKQLTHGHRNEWRTDCDWFHDKFMANAQTDCHPVGSDFWNVEPVNPWDYMPDFMKSHPYAKLEVIE